MCLGSSLEKSLREEEFNGVAITLGVGSSGVSLNLFLGSQVQVWSGSLGRPRGCLGSLSLSPALSVALSPDGDRVAVGYRADGIRIYKISSGTEGRRDGVFEPLPLTGFQVPSSLVFPLSLGSQGAQCQALDVAVSALAWLGPKVLVSGAEDGSLQGWALKESSLQSLWLLSRYQRPMLGLATSQELLASASGTAGQWAGQ